MIQLTIYTSGNRTHVTEVPDADYKEIVKSINKEGICLANNMYISATAIDEIRFDVVKA